MAENNKKTFIIDASFVLGFLLPDERVKSVDSTFELYRRGEITLVSSILLPFEVLNGLRTAVVRKRLSAPKAAKLAEAFLDLGIRLLEIDYQKTFSLAVQKKLSFYDAAYVYLSRACATNFLSLDRQLTKDGRENHSRGFFR